MTPSPSNPPIDPHHFIFVVIDMLRGAKHAFTAEDVLWGIFADGAQPRTSRALVEETLRTYEQAGLLSRVTDADVPTYIATERREWTDRELSIQETLQARAENAAYAQMGTINLFQGVL